MGIGTACGLGRTARNRPRGCYPLPDRRGSEIQAVGSNGGMLGYMKSNPALALALLASFPIGAAAAVADSAYTDFAAACAAALAKANTDRTLTVSKAWQGVRAQTCAANLDFHAGGLLQPAAESALILAGNVISPITRIFDITLQGSSVTFGPTVLMPEVYPQWWGAKGDGSNDDTAAIQAALDSVRGAESGAAFSGQAPIVFPSGTYRTTAQLRAYAAGPARALEYENYVVKGAGGAQASKISYVGPANQSAIRWMGGFGEISDLSIVDAGTGWIAGISYDGEAGLGRSTKGVFDHVVVNCNGRPGDGIDIGRTRLQADQLSIRDPFIVQCTSGAGVNVMDANAVSINLYNATISDSWVGVRGSAPGTNLSLFGGEIDHNDLNFYPAAGDVWLISGVRSENAKRTLYTNGGNYSESFTLMNYILSNIDASRPPARTTAAAGAMTVVLSAAGFTFGDAIVIAGAGAGGGDLHTYISSMRDPLTASIALAPVVTGVQDAQVTLDSSAQQNDLVENGKGPYVHINNFFSPLAGATVNASAAPQIFIGNTWTANISTPFGSGAGSGHFQSPVLLGNLVDGSNTATPMMNLTGHFEATFKPNATSQDVSRGNLFTTANSSNTAIANFTGGFYGQAVQVFISDTHTSFTTTGNLQLPGGAPVQASQFGVYEFVCRGNGGPWAMVVTSGK